MNQYATAPDFERLQSSWQQIVKEETSLILYNLQNQLGITIESVKCLQDILPALKLKDRSVEQIKRSVDDVTYALNRVRTCLRDVSFDSIDHGLPYIFPEAHIPVCLNSSHPSRPSTTVCPVTDTYWDVTMANTGTSTVYNARSRNWNQPHKGGGVQSDQVRTDSMPFVMAEIIEGGHHQKPSVSASISDATESRPGASKFHSQNCTTIAPQLSIRSTDDQAAIPRSGEHLTTVAQESGKSDQISCAELERIFEDCAPVAEKIEEKFDLAEVEELTSTDVLDKVGEVAPEEVPMSKREVEIKTGATLDQSLEQSGPLREVHDADVSHNEISLENVLDCTSYRNGEGSNQSHESVDGGASSPVVNGSETLKNVIELYDTLNDMDELVKSLETRWSFNESLTPVSSCGSEVFVRDSEAAEGSLTTSETVKRIIDDPSMCRCPESIEQFRIPPIMEYIPTVMSWPGKDHFCVQLMQDEEAILGLETAFQDTASGPSLSYPEVRPGDYVLCQFDEDECFYRAQLIKAKEDDKFEVLFVDYGNKCVASVKNMRKLSPRARRLGQSAIRCIFSSELQPFMDKLRESLESASCSSFFFACFAQEYFEQPNGPLFVLKDIQTNDGTMLLELPSPINLGPVNAKFSVHRLELKGNNMVKVNLVGHVILGLKIARAIRSLPSKPCERSSTKEGSLVSCKRQRGIIRKIGPGALVSLKLIDGNVEEIENVPLKECSLLPLAAIIVPPLIPQVVRIDEDNDLRDLIQKKRKFEMTVVEGGLYPLVKFS